MQCFVCNSVNSFLYLVKLRPLLWSKSCFGFSVMSTASSFRLLLAEIVFSL